MTTTNGNGHTATIDAPCLDAALRYREQGLPIAICKGKNPGAVVGDDWHLKRFSETEIERLFERDPELNVGLILGPPSGLIDLECDDDGAEPDYARLFDGCEIPQAPPTYLSRRGRHRIWKYHPKLAAIASLPGCQSSTKGAVVKFGALECRLGVGGKAAQSLLPPSTTDGFTREWVEGLSFDECNPSDLPELAVDRIVQAAAAKFKPRDPPKGDDGTILGGRPGDDFNARGSWDEAFGDSGWSFVEESGSVCYWRRPGKDDGWSGTTGFCSGARSGDLFYCFTDGAPPLEREAAYSKFAVFTLLHHAGDFSVAATALAAMGYGDDGLTLWKPAGRTDRANARRLVVAHGADFRYVPKWDQSVVWDGRRWEVDELLRFDALTKGVAACQWDEIKAAMAKDAGDKVTGEMLRFAKHSNSANGISAAMKLARSEPGIAIPPSILDTHSYLLNVANGTIDLTTGQLRPHCRDDHITKILTTKFFADAKAQRWEKFLCEVFADENGKPNDDLIQFVKRAAGYSLTGDTSERCLFFLWGKGKNGKSTLVTALQELLGEFATTITMDLLTVDVKKGIPAEIIDLFGARMAVANETEDASRLAESFIKQTTGGTDKQKGRRLYQQFFEFEQTHKLWICGNHKPRIRGTDDGVWDRIRLIPFNRRFEKPDKQLPAALAAEREGILAWAVEGCREWFKAKCLGEPKEVTAATQAYREECDTLGEFIAAKCITGNPRIKVRAGEIYGDYRKWAEASREYVLSLRKFGEAITAKGYQKQNDNGVWYLGIGLLKADDGLGAPPDDAGAGYRGEGE